jgi:peptidyl-prolyl cis-trans isomerase A (cyclophilin A)
MRFESFSMISSALMILMTAGMAQAGSPAVIMKTSMGDIKIELDDKNAPITVKNFLAYVNAKFYDGTIFHRVIENFMIQGGGFTKDMQQKPTEAPIKNEAQNGLKNDRGTVAMARTGVVDSATAQFFVNTVNNDFLNFRSATPAGYGYAVFGRVIEGMEVVDKIRKVKTTTQAGMQDVPVDPVIIVSIQEVK